MSGLGARGGVSGLGHHGVVRRIPPPMADHIPAFDWEVRKVWALTAPVERWPLDALSYLLDLPIWTAEAGVGCLFDLRPRDVLADPSRSPRHTRRIEAAELRWPLDFLADGDRLYVLDGIHRLAKHTRQGSATVPIRRHPLGVRERILRDA